MTDKEREIRITMWEAIRALWPIIVLLAGLFGSVTSLLYAQTQNTKDVVMDFKQTVALQYVSKDDYRQDIDRLFTEIENQNKKIDYLIKLHVRDEK